MKKIFSALMLTLSAVLFSAYTAQAQTGLPDPEEEKVYVVVEQLPKFPGGDEGLYKFISENLKYPSQELADAVEGRVFVSFIVDRQGRVSKAKVEKGVSEGLNQEAIRVINLLPDFAPAMQGGKPVNYRYILPISYKHGLSEKQVEKIRKVQEFERKNNLK